LSVPRVLQLLVAFSLPSGDREFVLGDLEEMYLRRLRAEGRASAARMYLRDGVASALARRLRRLPTPPVMGRPEQLKPGGTMFSDLPSDVRLALRSLRRRPGFSALVVFTLALGIGATTAVFALANQVLLRPLPGVRDPGGAGYLELRRVEDPDRPGGISALDFLELREAAASLEGLAAMGRSLRLVTLGPDDRPMRAEANWIHGDFFELLGVRALRGRLLSAEETSLEAVPNVAVISERFWSTFLGRSELAVGSSILVDGHPVTILGVAGGGFVGAERGDDYDLWIPVSALGTDPQRIQSRQGTNHGGSDPLLIRPGPGVSFEAVESELIQLLRRQAERNEVSRDVLINLIPRVFPTLSTIPMLREVTRAALRTMAFIALLILSIACANVANLLLFRGLGRRGDVAVRKAVGASWLRVARQELVGCLVFSSMGSVAGLGVAWVITGLFRGERLLFRAEEFQGLAMDFRVLGFVTAAMVTTTLLAAVLPAFLAGRVVLARSLDKARAGESTRHGFLRGAVSSAQLALCIPLLVGALLLTRTVKKLYEVELGMSPEGVVAFVMGDAGRQPVERHLQLMESVRGIPGVVGAALDYPGPFYSGLLGRVRLPTAAEEDVMLVNFFYATPGWFDLMGIRPLFGRTFQAEDAGPGAPPRALITGELAQRMFGRTDVVGRTIMARLGTPAAVEIVGVLGPVRMSGPGTEPTAAVFLPYDKRPTLSELSLMIRPRRFDAETARAIRDAAAATFPELPLAEEPTLLTARIDRQLGEQRVFARLLRLTSGLALLLSAVGLYGVIAFSVAARRRELGIRLALGSSFGRIAGVVLVQVVAIVAAGIVAGTLGAFALARLLQSQLFNVAPSDPRSYLSGAVMLAVAALLACIGPLRAAMRVDPAATLREP
jgi:predicted permease